MTRTAVVVALLLSCLTGLTGARPVAHASVAIGCAWLGETDQRDVNIGAPDLDAYYWLSPVVVQTGTHVVITGEYPRSRYMSLTAYDDTTQPLGSIYDQQIRPSPGSNNPFRAKPRPGRGDRYRITMAFTAAPRHPRANTMYVGHSSPIVLLEYRVYVPTDPHSPNGGVPWPAVTTVSAGGAPLTSLGGCAITPPSFGAPIWQLAANADYPAILPTTGTDGARPTPQWQRQFGSGFANEQNAYLAARTSHHYGQIVVIHARVPTFPNNRNGIPPYTRSQVRYWSFCTYDQDGETVFGCAADYRAAIRHHHVTYVVSDPDARPSNATTKHGVTWLPWGGTHNSGQIVYRNMLPSPGFHHAAQAITKPGQSANRKMGRYYPHAVYCATARFTRGGWKACFRAAHRH